jgi:hypothetical protein
MSDPATNDDSQLTVVLVHGAVAHDFRAVLPIGDKAVGTGVLRSIAERAGATATEADGSLVIRISQPESVDRSAMATAG